LDQSSPSRRYLGWTEPNKLRWAFARKYPWLERAYAAAYSDVAAAPNTNTIVTSLTGRLGYEVDSGDPMSSIELLRAFLRRIQWPADPADPAALAVQPPVAAPLAAATDWVIVNEEKDIREHAIWVTSTLLEEILGDDLNFSHIALDALQGKSRNEQIRLVLAKAARYVAVEENLRFEYLIDRSLLLEQVAQVIAEEEKP
jgi:hypothetical protein